MPLGEALSTLRQRFPDARKALIAYSGGRDSHALLHAASQQLDMPLRALHVAHGLQSAAADWPAHCAAQCAQLSIPLKTVHADVRDTGQGLEASARNARYTVFEAELAADEVLLLAHHAHDQAETLLLRLMRGTGLRGMAAMPESRSLGAGHLWRPFLALSVDAIADYAREQQLRWVEDPSNSDTRFDRNYLRKNVLPLLRERWPQADRQLAAASRRAGQADQLLASLIEPLVNAGCAADGSLDGLYLYNLASAQQAAVLRAWLQRYCPLAPSEPQLRAILRDVVGARADASPVFLLSGGSLRRYRGQLHWVSADLPVLPPRSDWRNPELPLQVGEHQLNLRSEFGRRLALPPFDILQIRFRTGGERIRLRGGERSLKKLLQDSGVPPWLRDRTPLLYADDQLVAVWNISIAANFDKSIANQ